MVKLVPALTSASVKIVGDNTWVSNVSIECIKDLKISTYKPTGNAQTRHFPFSRQLLASASNILKSELQKESYNKGTIIFCDIKDSVIESMIEFLSFGQCNICESDRNELESLFKSLQIHFEKVNSHSQQIQVKTRIKTEDGFLKYSADSFKQNGYNETDADNPSFSENEGDYDKSVNDIEIEKNDPDEDMRTDEEDDDIGMLDEYNDEGENDDDDYENNDSDCEIIEEDKITTSEILDSNDCDIIEKDEKKISESVDSNVCEIIEKEEKTSALIVDSNHCQITEKEEKTISGYVHSSGKTSEKINDKINERIKQNHLVRINGKYECLVCDTKYVKLQDMKSHLETKKHKNNLHNREIPKFPCDICPRVLKDTEALRAHLKNVHKIKYLCKACCTSFKTESEHLKHLEESHKDTLHNCKYCDASFRVFNDLKNHIKTNHPGKDHVPEFKCQYCGKVVRYKQKFQEHIAKVHEQTLKKDHVCSKCGLGFYKPWELRKHMRTHEEKTEEDKKYMCSICGASYLRPYSLKMHHEIVHVKKEFQCQTCQKCFDNFTRLQYHIKVSHESSEVYPCDLCDEVFLGHRERLRHKANVHIRTVSNKENSSSVKDDESVINKSGNNDIDNAKSAETGDGDDVVLEIQDMEGKTLKNLNTNWNSKEILNENSDKTEKWINERIERENLVFIDGQKFYKCFPCDKIFDKAYYYKHHLVSKSHQDKTGIRVEPKFPCDLCPRVLPHKKSLIDHIKFVHKLKFICRLCNEKYKEQVDYKKHLLDAHRETLFCCKFCDATFRFNSKLVAHIKTDHPGEDYMQENQCPYCGKIIRFKQHFKEHIERVHEKSITKDHVCAKCGKAFYKHWDLSKHMETHDENRKKDVICAICGAAYFTKEGLAKHHRIVHVDKDFQCEQCKKCFDIERKLYKHIKIEHENAKVYTCDFCDEVFLGHRERGKHVKYVHLKLRQKYKCKICDKEFDQHGKRQLHMKDTHGTGN